MDAALIVLDGWGLGPDDPLWDRLAQRSSSSADRDDEDGGTATRPANDRRNAVAAAETPTFDRLVERGAVSTLDAVGRTVGLPAGQMGNSEVGHLTIGAGRVVDQEYTRITDDIADGHLGENEAIDGAFEYARANDGRVHFLGLVSDGGVHSDQAHLHALLELAADRDVEAVTHAITDGRDTAPTGGREYLQALESVVDSAGTGDIATVSGRYYAMDRDQNWERTKRAYDAIVEREAAYEAPSALAAVEESYERGDTDEFVEPTVVADQPAIDDGDAVVWFNFRADRARQLTRLLSDIRPDDWADAFELSPPETQVVMLTEYDRTFDLPVAYPPNQPANVLGEVLAAAGATQLRIAESEKYAHVTYFLNGGREVEFDGERREIVESPDVPTYDERPEMSAAGVTDTAIEHLSADDPDVLVLNYANPDMVGHTGDFDAAVTAVEAVDTQLGRLLEAIADAGGHALVTADHGNADDMGTPADPHTAHTTNPVPVVYVSPDGTDDGRSLRDGATLADLAPTVLTLTGIDRPAAMTGRPLFDD
ncbi:2,3-bisphosphoglycerate-independent phosphoglycerate mutase [Halovivax ruber XH-70]|uniref:2,3-bisphosphoglycerate-independent phosphoglycerate mutase n=1 Tax=Halovivax ruber (strain DSM 18193 / JCM 13892 / XH-70) TaxID=797302 RepID=L0ICE8_HALRX|nr:2,3-bisphosphoglycerate-independent phosphoglycerate mutase [Halovivax ruber]AGB15886.1 2,3-bisphosphoglycerate-independent phosphoglycerate mutase [Halovivax ruber XH-70]